MQIRKEMIENIIITVALNIININDFIPSMYDSEKIQKIEIYIPLFIIF